MDLTRRNMIRNQTMQNTKSIKIHTVDIHNCNGVSFLKFDVAFVKVQWVHFYRFNKEN